MQRFILGSRSFKGYSPTRWHPTKDLLLDFKALPALFRGIDVF